jgi:hypothetical protein
MHVGASAACHSVAYLAVLLTIPGRAFAWGRKGDHITVIVAEHYLRPETAARYQHLSPALMAEAVGRLDGVFGLESPLEVPGLPEAGEAEAVTLAG